MVFPAANAYLVFDGSLAHGVLGSFYHGKRATMLVNWWTEQPQVRYAFMHPAASAQVMKL